VAKARPGERTFAESIGQPREFQTHLAWGS
jgi:hypothetical protein